MPKLRVCTKMERRTVGWANTSAAARARFAGDSGRRFSGANVSGWRKASHEAENVAKMAKAMNRQKHVFKVS